MLRGFSSKGFRIKAGGKKFLIFVLAASLGLKLRESKTAVVFPLFVTKKDRFWRHNGHPKAWFWARLAQISMCLSALGQDWKISIHRSHEIFLFFWNFGTLSWLVLLVTSGDYHYQFGWRMGWILCAALLSFPPPRSFQVSNHLCTYTLRKVLSMPTSLLEGSRFCARGQWNIWLVKERRWYHIMR